MAGQITDLRDRVSSSNTGRPVIANLNAPKALGASSITINDATNWDDTSVKYFAIYNTTAAGIKDPTTQTDWKGTLSGTTISNLTLTGGTDRSYSAGAIVELTYTSRAAKDTFDQFTAIHEQTGQLKPNVIQTSAIANSAVTPDKQNNLYKFSAYRNAALTLTSASNFNKVVCDSEEYDTNNNFTNGTYTAPVTGNYFFNAQVEWNLSPNTAFIIATLYKNGTEFKRGVKGFNRTGGNDNISSNVVARIRLNAGDTVDFYAFVNLSAGLLVGAPYVYFQGGYET